MSIFKDALRTMLEFQGRQISPYPDRDLMRRMKLIEHFRINKIFDVGANDGYYTFQMKKLGFKGPIISFEPIRDVFEKLRRVSSKYKGWEGENIALGDSDSEAVINIAGNAGGSSSILDMLPAHINVSPEARYVATENIVVRKLDSIFEKYYREGDSILLKIDTQGFERNVLAGAEESLKRIKGIQIELSLLELYNGQMLYREMIQYLEERGFRLYSLENGFYDRKVGQLLQLDGIFYRPEND
jgi:FkbM family methyltransferase